MPRVDARVANTESAGSGDAGAKADAGVEAAHAEVASANVFSSFFSLLDCGCLLEGALGGDNFFGSGLDVAVSSGSEVAL